ncbi:MAG: DUF6438 domain-containing protein [Armatimonadota bacterium]|nr:DUF6438 domain-containing protein [Armatimonadota bacterium]
MNDAKMTRRAFCWGSLALLDSVVRADPAPKTLPEGDITEIRVERTWCYGGCPIDTLIVGTGGAALYTGRRSVPRLGDYAAAADYPDALFPLAHWLTGQGFFDLKDSYGQGNIDIADTILTVARGGQRKTVVNHGLGQSDLVWGMATAVHGFAADLMWQPVPSGLHGLVLWRPRPTPQEPRPNFLPMTHRRLSIRANGDRQELEFIVKLDDQGRFSLPLNPGVYTVDFKSSGKNPQTVTIQPDRYLDLTFRDDHAIR